jgi:hypothetical protein
MMASNLFASIFVVSCMIVMLLLGVKLVLKMLFLAARRAFSKEIADGFSKKAEDAKLRNSKLVN